MRTNREPKARILLPTVTTCGLCEKESSLRRSHILPDYMGEWAKSVSAIKRFRERNCPNRLVQDLPKIPLLCEDCEQRIGVWENNFKKAIFLPWCERLEAGEVDELPEDVTLGDEEWMQLLTFSIAWRALHVASDGGRRLATLSPLAARAHATWRPALLAGELPPESYFWVIQSRGMDKLLKRQGHEANRAYVLLKTDVGSSELVFAVKPLYGFDFQAKEIGTYHVSYGKGFGFCFLGVHVEDRVPPISLDKFLEEIAARRLDTSIRESRDIEERRSPGQRAVDEAARNMYVQRPTLSMRLRLADDEERDEHTKHGQPE